MRRLPSFVFVRMSAMHAPPSPVLEVFKIDRARQALAIGAWAASGQLALLPPMHDFIHRKNLEHYRKLLAGTPDNAEPALLLRLLVEEEAKEPLSKMAAKNDEH